MAHGQAIKGLKSIIEQASATLVGASIAIEKGFQGGGDAMRREGVDVFSLAIIETMQEDGLTFRN